MTVSQRMSLGRYVCASTLALALLALGGGVAQAAARFDDQGYSTCTATKVLGPEQSIDDMVTACCVDHGGAPVGTNYGVGCVAQVDNPAPDYRPTIFMPTRPSPIGDSDYAREELDKLPPPPDAQQP